MCVLWVCWDRSKESKVLDKNKCHGKSSRDWTGVYCTSVPQNILVRRRRIAHFDHSAKVSSQALNQSDVVTENAKPRVRLFPFIPFRMQVNAVLRSKSFILFLTNHLSPNEKFDRLSNNYPIIRRASHSDDDYSICIHASSIVQDYLF